MADPVVEHIVLRNHPFWCDRQDFLCSLRDRLDKLGIKETRVDSVVLAKSQPNLDVRWKDLRTDQVVGMVVKENGSGVITLNKRFGSKAQQWACAHELTHFWLHPDTQDIDPSDEEANRIFDIQANWGARELKMPEELFSMAVLYYRGPDDRMLHYLSSHFNVGKMAVRYRIEDLVTSGTLETYRKKIREHVFINARIGLAASEGSMKLMGIDSINNRTSKQGEQTFTVIKVDNDGRCLACPRCGNSVFADDGDYCPRCGLFRRNDCLDEHCSRVNGPYAAYCEYCGANTAWQNAGIVTSWQEETGQNGDVPQDNIPDLDDVPF